MPSIDSNRLSQASQLANRGSVDLEDARHSVGSADSTRAQRSTSELGAGSIARPSIGRPARLTMPKAPGAGAAQEPQGVQSIQEGLEKTTRAKVDVARRSFWGKCIGSTLTVVGLALFAASTGGVGLVAGATVALMTGFAAKALGDTALSFMNWRNKKAELLGQPPPYPKLNDMPKSVREDSMAAALVGLGVSEKKASTVSRFTGLALGLGAASSYGYAVGGLAGMGLALIPVAAEQALHHVNHKLEHKREAHTERAAEAMRQRSLQTEAQLRELQDSVLQQLSDQTDQPLSELEIGMVKAELDDLRESVTDSMKQAQEALQQRVENKVAKGTSGVGAIALDVVVNEASTIPEHLAGVHLAPVHVIGASAMALRAGTEAWRTMRSMKRDDQKLQQFNAVHQELASMMQKVREGILDRIKKPNATDNLDEVLSSAAGGSNEQPPGHVIYA